jgi:hypothetical protein
MTWNIQSTYKTAETNKLKTEEENSNNNNNKTENMNGKH